MQSLDTVDGRIVSWGSRHDDENSEVVNPLLKSLRHHRHLQQLSFAPRSECHKDLLRLVVINALDLANNPSNADTKIVFLQLSLKPNHQNLPPGAKFEPVVGRLLAIEEVREEMAKQENGKAIMDAVRFAHDAGKTRGTLGLTCFSLRVDLPDSNEDRYIMDHLQIPLPTHEEAIQMIARVRESEMSIDWVNDWVGWLSSGFRELDPG
jgi:hypothetical protein